MNLQGIHTRNNQAASTKSETGYPDQCKRFCQGLEKWHHISSLSLLDKSNNKSLLKIDKDLYSLLKNIELLAEVNPINTIIEKNRFSKVNSLKRLTSGTIL